MGKDYYQILVSGRALYNSMTVPAVYSQAAAAYMVTGLLNVHAAHVMYSTDRMPLHSLPPPGDVYTESSAQLAALHLRLASSGCTGQQHVKVAQVNLT